jgi:hypothetical protein
MRARRSLPVGAIGIAGMALAPAFMAIGFAAEATAPTPPAATAPARPAAPATPARPAAPAAQPQATGQPQALTGGSARPAATAATQQPAATQQTAGAQQTPETEEGQQIDAKAELKGVLTQPFDDFNLTRAEIPEGLIPIRNNPYGLRANVTCAQLTEEIVYIDGLVGADLEPVPQGEGDDSLLTRENTTTAARNVARSAASSWIPFRGLVRELTGAEAHARAFKEAVLAGMVRRAYLKGLREARRCPAAAPARTAAPTR